LPLFRLENPEKSKQYVAIVEQAVGLFLKLKTTKLSKPVETKKHLLIKVKHVSKVDSALVMFMLKAV